MGCWTPSPLCCLFLFSCLSPLSAWDVREFGWTPRCIFFLGTSRLDSERVFFVAAFLFCSGFVFLLFTVNPQGRRTRIYIHHLTFVEYTVVWPR